MKNNKSIKVLCVTFVCRISKKKSRWMKTPHRSQQVLYLTFWPEGGTKGQCAKCKSPPLEMEINLNVNIDKSAVFAEPSGVTSCLKH